jgi:pyruvate dehydrogenase E1 component alpha subunit
MNVPNLTIARLRAFESRVAAAFDRGEIAGPVHLSDGNEQQLIDYFTAHYHYGDYIFGTWRAHYHALLAGVSEEELFTEILAGCSISLCFPAQQILCSAIVGGHVPIAVGVAMGIKRRIDHLHKSNPPSQRPHVHCFLGDMAAETGLFYEARKYAINHNLPITFIIESNSLSVCTPTVEAWGYDLTIHGIKTRLLTGDLKTKTVSYAYDGSRYPHSGSGERTNF